MKILIGVTFLVLGTAANADRVLEPVLHIDHEQAAALLSDEADQVASHTEAVSALDQINNLPATAAGESGNYIISAEAADLILGEPI